MFVFKNGLKKKTFFCMCLLFGMLSTLTGHVNQPLTVLLRDLYSQTGESWTFSHQVWSVPNSVSAVTPAPGPRKDHTNKQHEYVIHNC